MRALPLQHWLVASFCAGLALANVVRLELRGGGLTGAAAAIVVALVCGLCGRASLRVAAVCGLCALCGLAFASHRLDSLERSRLTGHAGEQRWARVTVTGPVRVAEYGLSAPAHVDRFGGLRLSEPVWLELEPGRKPETGAILRLKGLIRLPNPKSASGFDQRAWLDRQGIHVVLEAEGWRQVGRRGGLAGFGDRLRKRLVHDLGPGLKGERRGLVLGLVLGQDEGLPPELRDSFRRSGLYHLLAVSGQNIAFLVAGVLAFCWLGGIPRWLGELLALGTIGAYVLVVGWQPSVVRAAVAGALASLAWLAARPRDRWYFLAIGAAVLLGWNPKAIFDPGFQLSFAAVAGIFLGERPAERVLKRLPLPGFLRPVLAVSFVCTLATTPVMLTQFEQVPVYGLFGNILVEPVVPLILFLALACALVAPIAFPAATTLAMINGLLASYIGFCACTVGSVPGAQVSRGDLLRVCPFLLVLAVGPFLLRPRLPRFCALGLLVLIPFWGWQHRIQLPPSPPHGLRISFLDVGEGDATLLETPEGAVLVDAGAAEAGVAGQVERLAGARIEALVLSHPHADHVGGAAEVLRKLDVGLVLDSGLPSNERYELEALAEARRRNVPVEPARAGQELRVGDLRLQILSPSGDGSAEAGAGAGGDANESAIVVVASYGALDVLLPADAESPFTTDLVIRPVEVYKVAHHASADEGLPELLERLRPRVAVVSVGENDYGHPAPSTLAALAARDQAPLLLRTDREGRIVLESDGFTFSVRGGRSEPVSLPCG